MAMAAALSSSSSSLFFFSSTTWRGAAGPQISKQLLNLSGIAAARPGGRGWGSHKVTGISASISSKPKEELRTRPDELVNSILSMVINICWSLEGPALVSLTSLARFKNVTQTDRGVLLTRDEHNKVAEVAQELGRFCVDEPVKCPLIFGEWDVVYCSVPTSPGGGYRSAFGRLVFKTKEMIQFVEAPDAVKNRVSFSAFGFLDGEVSLEGKLKALDEKWIQVVFEPPQLKVGAIEFQYGGQSEVKLEITYIDDKIRLGKGSRGSLFVFQRL